MTQWFTPRGESPWISKSADGYYAVSKGPPFVAHHIEALWARPVPIASSVTLELAQQCCDDHRQRETVPA